MKRFEWLLLLVACSKGGVPSSDHGATAAPRDAPAIDVATVISRPLETVVHLEGELSPFEEVALHARANGFVTKVFADRGSEVKQGQVLVTISAPELSSQRAEAVAKLQADKSTFERLQEAAKTPGAVAGHEVEVAEGAFRAAEAKVRSLRELEQYLVVTAPFDGVITERNVHPGALVGSPSTDKGVPMLRIQQIARLRLTTSVPESLVGTLVEGTPATFAVRAWPGETFTGITRRISHSVDTKTRTMAVELDVENQAKKLAPGMFADVAWSVKRSSSSLFVPPTSVVQSTEKTFVARVRDGLVEQVQVQRGATMGDLLEVIGSLQAGDQVARRGSEELRVGVRVTIRPQGKDGGAQ